ncbi:MAG: hypothetical protein LUQ04_03335 [Methanoregula sp.]|nr:hypothetical protein [Methanoregula sp.]
MEGTGHKSMTVKEISCPLCGYMDVRYRKETDTYVCGHCDYSWYTIEQCNNRGLQE